MESENENFPSRTFVESKTTGRLLSPILTRKILKSFS
jgi:hypothetical protein